MEILEAYDLTKSFRSAAALTGCDHHTVARYVAARAAGLDPSTGGDRPSVTEPFVDKIHEWVEPFRRPCPRRHRARQARSDGLSGLGAHDPPGRRGGQGAVAAQLASGLHAVDHRTGVVVAVGLRGRADAGRAAGRVVRRLVGVVAVPGGRPVARPHDAVGDRRHRRDVPPDRRRPDVRADRQRKDGDGSAHRWDRRAQPADRRRRALPRPDDRHLCAGRPRVEGRFGVDSQAGQGRSGPDRSQPARRLRVLGAARRRL